MILTAGEVAIKILSSTRTSGDDPRARNVPFALGAFYPHKRG